MVSKTYSGFRIDYYFISQKNSFIQKCNLLQFAEAWNFISMFTLGQFHSGPETKTKCNLTNSCGEHFDVGKRAKIYLLTLSHYVPYGSQPLPLINLLSHGSTIISI